MINDRQTVLVTGGAGFIGSNFIQYYLRQNKEIRVVNIDKLTYAGSLKNLSGFKNDNRHTFIEGDICDEKLIHSIFLEYEISSVIHFAAESHVDNSIDNPDNFIATNINGTYILLKTAKHFWTDLTPNAQGNRFRFHHVSTDEVYGSLGEKGVFDENTPYAPNSPYSASKAASDFLVRSYHHTYGLNTVISNCSNNYGPNQHNEKLIPTIIRKALAQEAIPIYGDGTNVRDWLYVEDHCAALQKVFENGISGETYAIGGDNELSNMEVAEKICEYLDDRLPRKNGPYKDLITFVKDRPGHDYRYAINASKIKDRLGWRTKENFSSGLKKTIEHYLNLKSQEV